MLAIPLTTLSEGYDGSVFHSMPFLTSSGRTSRDAPCHSLTILRWGVSTVSVTQSYLWVKQICLPSLQSRIQWKLLTVKWSENGKGHPLKCDLTKSKKAWSGIQIHHILHLMLSTGSLACWSDPLLTALAKILISNFCLNILVDLSAH